MWAQTVDMLFKTKSQPGFLFPIQHPFCREERKIAHRPTVCITMSMNMVNFVPPCSIITLPATISPLRGPAQLLALFHSGPEGPPASTATWQTTFPMARAATQPHEFRLRRTSLGRQGGSVVVALVSEQRREKIGRKVAKTTSLAFCK